MWQVISLKSETNNPWFIPWFNILLHTQSIVCATVLGQCLECLGYITLPLTKSSLNISLCQSKLKRKCLPPDTLYNIWYLITGSDGRSSKSNSESSSSSEEISKVISTKDFQIVQKLGVGGFGNVFLAKYRQNTGKSKGQ